MAFATGRDMDKSFYAGAYDVEDVVGMVRQVYAGRVEFHDGNTELAPNISLHLVGGHTRGLQVVRLWTAKGWLVLASDASHYLANMQQGRPFPIVADVDEMIVGWDTLRNLADSPDLIIPGHDPVVMEAFAAPAPQMQGIVVKLA